MKCIYLHGFASSPDSQKARAFAQRWKGRTELLVPDLAGGDFEHLTISGQLRVLEKLAACEQVKLIGSSMGGYLAALYASRHPEAERLVLLAPAFGFIQRWPEQLGEERFAEWRRSGSLEVYHFAEKRQRQVWFGLYEDALQYPLLPDFSQPALLFHGKRDAVVPVELSMEYASTHPNTLLEVLDSDHELLDVVDYLCNRANAFLDAR
jgi:pimeloyl-ACP methyl ester carboxylesterase